MTPVPDNAPGSIAGRVVDRSGRPQAGATVMVARCTHPFPDIAAVTGEQGEFRFSHATPGHYELAARGPSGNAGHVAGVVAPATEAHTEIRLDD